MNKTDTKPLLLYFLFFIGFSLLLVACDRLFPSNNVVPTQDQAMPANIRNIILEVPVKPVFSTVGMTCENNFKIRTAPAGKNLFVQNLNLSAYNYDAFNNSLFKL